MTPKKTKKKKIYWGKEQEEAVKLYLELDPTSMEAERLFETKIYEPMKKLVENIMFTYRLNVPDSIEEQIQDTIGFIVTKMRKFDSDSGHRSFSYYGTIAKNYMIMKKNKFYNKLVQSVDIEDTDGFEMGLDIFDIPEIEKDEKSTTYLIHQLAEDLEYIARNDLTMDKNVYKVIEAIVFVLENYQKINIQNKRQFYFIVREFTGLSAKEITKAMNEIKYFYIKTKKFVL
jgi:hypothetical protein